MSGANLHDEVPVEADGALPDGLLTAFWAYDDALLSNDVPELDRLFAEGPATLRGDGTTLAVGYPAISAFRAARTAIPNRRTSSVHVRVLGADDALIVAEVVSPTGTAGLQTQLWRRGAAGSGAGRAWAVAAAHVSAPQAAIDRAVWRAVGAPLLGATASGALDGETVAVKDLYAVRGFSIGAGVPEFAANRPAETANAAVVDALLGAGASITGIAQTDQFAYSIGGRNLRYGAPLNPLRPNSLPGGSSSGSASAVARGWASIGLGTDTAGSIRVPAAYQGLWSIRTTHGLVDHAGCLPLAPSFDTVGWLVRDPALLETVATVLVPGTGASTPSGFLVSPALLALATGESREASARVAEALGATSDDPPIDLEAAFLAFRVVQGFEAWQADGDWVSAHPGVLDADVAARFADASAITAAAAADARALLSESVAAVRAWLGDRILVLPTTSGPAPLLNASAAEVDAERGRTLRLTALASYAGLPAVAAPAPAAGAGIGAAPTSVCFIGAPGTDLALIRAVAAARSAFRLFPASR